MHLFWSGFLNLQLLWLSAILLNVSGVHSLLLLIRIPFYGYSTKFIHLSIEGYLDSFWIPATASLYEPSYDSLHMDICFPFL